jgi:hypothetical protein
MEGTLLKRKAGIHPQCICLGVLILAAVVLPGVESVEWIMGVYTGPYVGNMPYIGRCDTWLEGPPTDLMYAAAAIRDSNLGDIPLRF